MLVKLVRSLSEEVAMNLFVFLYSYSSSYPDFCEPTCCSSSDTSCCSYSESVCDVSSPSSFPQSESMCATCATKYFQGWIRSNNNRHTKNRKLKKGFFFRNFFYFHKDTFFTNTDLFIHTRSKSEKNPSWSLSSHILLYSVP